MQIKHPVIATVQNYIQQKRLLKDNSKVIVGVSGGADSIALLYVLKALGYECIVAHCNFHLRGQESYRDEYFVEQVANKLELPFLSANFDTRKYIEDEAISVEMAARELRYAWFEKIRKEHNADKIAVAHHMNDSVETVLINLVRGTGIKGLSGISPINGNIIRPLLCLYREDIVQYLKKNDLKYVTDSTNKEDIYTRNKIRLNIIPLFKLINPSAVETIARSAENLSKTEKIYNHYLDLIKEKIFIDNKINISLLLLEPEPTTILFEILNPYGFNASTVTNIFESNDKQSGKVFYSDQYQVVKDRDFFIVQPILNIEPVEYRISEMNEIEDLPVRLDFYLLKKSDILELNTSTDTIYIDFSKIEYPLILRKWKQGDKFIPFGMKGNKKLSDYFTDHKFNLIEKENAWILCSANGDVIWLVGHRMDDRFKITENTENVLRITLSD